MGSASKSLPLWGRWPAVGGSDEVDVQQRKVNDVALGGLLRLTPGPVWLERLEAAFPEPPDAFCETLARFRGMRPEPESLALFALAIKRIDGAADDGRFERRLRQRAAECLRLNANDATSHGGGLYACALARSFLTEAIP